MPHVTPEMAMNERFYYILTVWESYAQQQLDGWAIRLGNGTFGGETLKIANAAGDSLYYEHVIPASREFTQMFSLASQAVPITTPWLWDDFDPIDLNLEYMVGELARIWTVNGQSAMDTWESRLIMISGDVGATWGTNRQKLNLTLSGTLRRDSGQMWPPGAELDTDRFGDIADTGDRDRAHESDGALPPIIYAPVGSEMKAPLILVKNTVDAAAPVDMVWPRFLAGKRRPASSGSAHQLQFWDPRRKGRFMAGDTSAAYQATPQQGTDDLGDPYWYFGQAGDFIETVVGSYLFVTATTSVAYTQSKGAMTVDDQVKGASGANDDYLPITSIDGGVTHFGSAYQGPTPAPPGEDVDILRLTEAKAYPGYRICSLGGDDSPDGTGPITAVVDVLVDALQHADMGVPIAIGDLQAMRGRFEGIDISHVLSERQAPWDWALVKILEWLPIRPYRDNGVIRFRWVGPVADEEVVAVIDLDELGPAYRFKPFEFATRPVYPFVRTRYRWDMARSKPRFTRTVTHDGSDASRATAATLTGWVGTGRAVEAYHEWKPTDRPRTPQNTPMLLKEIDTLETRIGAGLATNWLMYRNGLSRPAGVLDVDRSASYFKRGDVIQVNQEGATWDSQKFGVEMIGFKGTGQGKVHLEWRPD